MLFEDNLNIDLSLGINSTTANSASLGSQVPGDGTVTVKLRAKGEMIITKANLGEMAEYKGEQRHGPYDQDLTLGRANH